MTLRTDAARRVRTTGARTAGAVALGLLAIGLAGCTSGGDPDASATPDGGAPSSAAPTAEPTEPAEPAEPAEPIDRAGPDTVGCPDGFTDYYGQSLSGAVGADIEILELTEDTFFNGAAPGIGHGCFFATTSEGESLGLTAIIPVATDPSEIQAVFDDAGWEPAGEGLETPGYINPADGVTFAIAPDTAIPEAEAVYGTYFELPLAFLIRGVEDPGTEAPPE